MPSPAGAPGSPVAPVVPTAPDAEATRVVARANPPLAPATPVVPTTSAKPAAKDAAENVTFVLPHATLSVSVGPDAKITEHRLGPVTAVGRTDTNQIQIPRPGVSRRHAVIEYTASGFVLKDAESQNGTFLNGERVATRTLASGDRITIADVQLVFRLI